MKLENNWWQKSLESFEKKNWPALNSDEGSYLIKTCNSLRKKQIQDFTAEDLRIMIGQEIGLYFLIPSAIETLNDNLFCRSKLSRRRFVKKCFRCGDQVLGQQLKLLATTERTIKKQKTRYNRNVVWHF